MTRKKTTKTANACATIYEGKFDINFDCVGVNLCKFALCIIMPPTGDDECHYLDYGSCISPHAKLAAVDLLKNRLLRAKKDIEESLEG